MDRDESSGNKRYIRESLIYIIYISIMRERKREHRTVNHKKKIIKIVRESLKFPKQRGAMLLK